MSSLGFNSQLPSASTSYPRSFGSPAPAGPSQYTHFQHGTTSQSCQPPAMSSAIDPQLNMMTPTRQSQTSEQTLSFPPPPPAQPPRQSHVDASSSFGGQPDFQDTADLDVNPSFIDALSQSMGFSEADEEYRKGLHAFPKLARGMPRSQMQSHLIQVALLYSILKECRTLAEASRSSRSLMAEIQVRLEETFTISQEQKMNIRLIAGEMMLEPTRVMYMKIHIDVEERIREKQTELRFMNIFGNLCRQRLLSTQIRRICSSVRNSYRELLRDSVIGSNTVPLDDFACIIANRFSVSGRMALGRAGVGHIALLRRFAYEHPQLLDRHAGDDDDNDHDITGGMSTPSDHLDTEDASISSGTTSAISRPQKRKRSSQPSLALACQKGSDFWSMVDKWFLARMKPDQLGTPWSSPGWIKYIEDTIDRDHAHFKPVPHVNPFFEDFADDETTYTSDNISVGAAQSHAAGAVGLAGLIHHV